MEDGTHFWWLHILFNIGWLIQHNQPRELLRNHVFVGLNSTMVELFLPPGGWAKFIYVKSPSLMVQGFGYGSCCFWTAISKFETFSVHLKFEVTGSLRWFMMIQFDDDSIYLFLLTLFFFNWVSTNDELVKFEFKYLLYDMSLYVVMSTTCVVECSW